MVMGGLWVVLILAAVIGMLVVWGPGVLSNTRGRAAEPAPFEPAPLEILKRRYAAGEITVEEFEQAKRALA